MLPSTNNTIPSPFDPHVAFAVVTSLEDNAISLLPQEHSLLSEKASPKRRIEVIRGRAAARRAITLLGGRPDTVILRGDRREPLFPEPYRGSISHTDDLAVAAVARSDRTISIGVDVQRISSRFTPELTFQFTSELERNWINEEEATRIERACIIFSAKESIFKALNPIVKVWFGFECAEIKQLDSGILNAIVRPFKDDGTQEFSLNVWVSKAPNYIVTGIVVDSGLVPHDQ